MQNFHSFPHPSATHMYPALNPYFVWNYPVWYAPAYSMPPPPQAWNNKEMQGWAPITLPMMHSSPSNHQAPFLNPPASAPIPHVAPQSLEQPKAFQAPTHAPVYLPPRIEGRYDRRGYFFNGIRFGCDCLTCLQGDGECAMYIDEYCKTVDEENSRYVIPKGAHKDSQKQTKKSGKGKKVSENVDKMNRTNIVTRKA